MKIGIVCYILQAWLMMGVGKHGTSLKMNETKNTSFAKRAILTA